MAKKKKLYEVRPDSQVYAISLVECPAIESNFVYLSEEKPIQVCLEQDEKHMVFGAVLIPDKPIYRYNQDEEYYLRFPKETIEVLAHEYLQNDNIYSFTQQHKENADGVSIIESWVKTSNNDKSVDLGIDAPIGTWFVGAKIDNEEINKCDKGLIVLDDDKCILVELKGCDVSKACIQLNSTLDIFKKKLLKVNNYDYYCRAVVTSMPSPNNYPTSYKILLKNLNNCKNKLICKSKKLEEKI